MDQILNIDIFDGLDPEDEKWETLVKASIAGDVVPVIGPDIICDFPGNMNINEFLIEVISKQLRIKEKHTTFSQLVYNPEFLARLQEKGLGKIQNKNVIYSLVHNIVSNSKNANYFKPSELLKRLLSIRLFPFVITTSFSPVVENTMREIWGTRDVRVLGFCNNPAKDRKPGEGDILDLEDMRRPTIYYMFGKSNVQPLSYVLTDNDMLEFCKSWLSEQRRPNNLCTQLKDKYLLMLGCGYSDWLFRLIWFCMNKTTGIKTTGLMARDGSTHETLVEYLRRLDTFMPSNKTPSDIVSEIEKRLASHIQENEVEWFLQPKKSNAQVFISYSRSDSDVAEALYKYLMEHGISVWYDRKDLAAGSKFMDEIESAIERCKVFIPIISNNIAKEAMEVHVYRKEWKKAIDMQESMGSRSFIMPIHEAGFDFYASDIPKELKKHDSKPYDESYDFSAILDSINSALNKLDNYRSFS